MLKTYLPIRIPKGISIFIMRRFFSLVVLHLFTLALFAQQRITFPCNLASYLNQEVLITNPLYVTNNYYLEKYGQLTLSSQRLRGGTETELPGSAAYESVVARNNEDQLELASSGRFEYKDGDGTRRTGSIVTNLQGKIVYKYGKYMLEPTVAPLFTGNERSARPASVGECNVKVASANLEYYMADPAIWSNSNNNGAQNAAEFSRQRSKTGRALLAMDADIYALCEVGEGSKSLQDLVDVLNELSETERYKYVQDNNTVSTTYTKNGFVYDSETVRPYGKFTLNEVSGLSNLNKRKAAIGFELLQNGERFVVNMNHFLSKRSSISSGDNDQGDGQGKGNATRVKEARATLDFLKKLEIQFGDADILVVGDLNAYSKEDPIRLLENGGLINQIQRYAPEGYSYSYIGEAGYLDHVLATGSMSEQITGSRPWHVNTDEPAYLSYPNAATCKPDDPYRYADHDPIVTGILLGKTTGMESSAKEPDRLVVSGSAKDGFLILKAPRISRILVADISGRVVFHDELARTADHYVLSVEGLCSGCYLVQVETGQKKYTSKFIISK